MTPAERSERKLTAIREAGRRRARQSPPLTQQDLEALAFILAPSYASLTRARTAEAA